ncbi:MAG: SpoIIE family protein phosphatase [Bacilli bacterium]|nr:SpoIIE family protein phosphatase [Bacilli bacterium]
MNEKDIYLQNEKKANISLAFTSLVLAVFMLVTLILNVCKVQAFLYSDSINLLILLLFPILIVALALPACLLKTKLSSQHWFKYFILISFVVAIAVLGFLVPQEGIFFAACVVASTLYFRPKTTRIVFYVTLGLMIVAPVVAVALNNYEPITYGMNINKYAALFIFNILPRVLAIVVIAQIANGLALRADKILGQEVNEVKRNQKVTSELSIASAIQSAVLPKEFPDSKYGELYAIMDPAKEVGGDFYDFFEIDDDHLAIVIGDASGKGIPSSLYMMKAQSLIRALAKDSKYDTAKIINEANAGLCEGNEYNMFVTCWLGILDKESGELRFTNAGHNPPIIKSNGKFSYLSAKPGLVLGGFKDFEYKEAKTKLNKGDKLFLYTDGVTEAHNVRSELYGEDRLIEMVSNLDASPYETVTKIRNDIREFSRNAEQFDDITMLMVEYRKAQSVFSKKFEAKADNLENVQNFILSSIKGDLDVKDKNQLLIVSEEVFINIASYAYEGKGYCTVDVNYENDVLTLVFSDNGVKFDPLAKEDPNTKQKAEDRQIGGLGIFMVKNLMDKVYYEYKDGKNILTMIKKY